MCASAVNEKRWLTSYLGRGTSFLLVEARRARFFPLDPTSHPPPTPPPPLYYIAISFLGLSRAFVKLVLFEHLTHQPYSWKDYSEFNFPIINSL